MGTPVTGREMRRLLVSTLITAIVLSTPLRATHARVADQALIVVRGRVVCLDSAGRPLNSLFACDETNRSFGFSTKDGKLYKFLPADAMTAMFTDMRVRQRDLQITARLRAGDQLELIKVQSVKEGKLYDIFYFCEVCNIRAYAPGPCPCCRNELEFRETPT